MKFSRFILAASLGGAAVCATAAPLDGFVGVGLGIPQVAYGSSDLAYKIFGGYKVHQFEIGKAGLLDLAIQGEYVDFGNSSALGASWSQSGVAVSGLGSWVIPRKWAAWADEKVAVLVKVGGSRVEYSSNRGTSVTSTGLTEGIGAEYRVIPNFAVRAMVEYYPSSYNIYGISAVLKF